MTKLVPWEEAMTILITAGTTALTALLVAIATYLLTKRREHEGDWRRIKFDQYREYLMALSGILEGRSTSDAQARYSDAINGMYLVSPKLVLNALIEYQDEISCRNLERDQMRQDRLLNTLITAMRADMLPGKAAVANGLQFHLITVPPMSTTTGR